MTDNGEAPIARTDRVQVPRDTRQARVTGNGETLIAPAGPVRDQEAQ